VTRGNWREEKTTNGGKGEREITKEKRIFNRPTRVTEEKVIRNSSALNAGGSHPVLVVGREKRSRKEEGSLIGRRGGPPLGGMEGASHRKNLQKRKGEF